MPGRRACVLWILAGGVLGCQAGLAQDSTAEPTEELDAELLEFLGSIDADDADWIEYLSQTDIAKVASESAKPSGEQPDEQSRAARRRTKVEGDD